MDGTGYPRRLPGEALHLTERVMAVADVFEALTAADRPYKLPKTLSESLRIMAVMCRSGTSTPSSICISCAGRIWLAYAQQHMNPSQIDDVGHRSAGAHRPGLTRLFHPLS
ncbi:HD-GYP domain-containing protein [Bordetella pertussis]|uniref:HD-GYP domain-containing protein n=1 Tax=Bordetella pertussis TaxID=520 RepID=UPI00374F3FB5